MSDKKALADFLAAAKQQESIEAIVSRRGEDTRAALERRMFIDLGGGAALRLEEPNLLQRRMAHVLHYTQTEIQPILTVLIDLPADHNGCRFTLKCTTLSDTEAVLRFEIYYMHPEAVKDFSYYPNMVGEQPAFHIQLSRMSDAYNSTVGIRFSDFSRLSSHVGIANETIIYPADSQDLRALIGSCVARIAPHRVAEMIAAIERPPASENSAPQLDVMQHMKQDGKRFKLPPQ